MLCRYSEVSYCNKLDKQKAAHDGREYMRYTTLGWLICCEWKVGSTSWENLSDLMELHPLQIAKYLVAMGVDHKPAFDWWVPHMFKKCNAIIALVKKRSARYLNGTPKFGNECPKVVDDALALDKKSRNTVWADVIAKEKKNVQVAFNVVKDGLQPPHG